MFSRFLGWCRGDNVEFKNPVELIAKNDGREAVRVQTVGTVKVQFNIAMKDMDLFGIFPFKG